MKKLFLVYKPIKNNATICVIKKKEKKKKLITGNFKSYHHKI